MAIWELKKCPRCGGDMFIDGDIYGWYEKCLQCSFCCELINIDEIKQGVVQKAKLHVGKIGDKPKRR